MTYVNSVLRQQSIARTTPPQDQYGFTDVFAASAEETLRTLPTASLIRGVANLFDSSEPINAEEANQEYNLSGEAAFKPDEEVTVDMAAARAADQSRLTRNAHIQGMFAQDHPIQSVVASFTGSMAAGFMDPALMALNVGAGLAVTKGLQAVITNTKIGRAGLNALGAYSPRAGQAVQQVYSTHVAQSATSHLVREGAENFIASVAEETINFAGIGEDRLARKVSAQESLRNIVLGTTLGTGFGTILNKGSREAVSNRMGRLFGDQAPETVHTQTSIAAMEAKMNMGPTGFIQKVQNEETFGAKQWHTEKFEFVDVSNAPETGRFFIPISKDGEAHMVSHRGDGVVLTSNSNHAQNLGTEVRELDVSQAKIFKPDQFQGESGRVNKLKGRMVNRLLDDFFEGNTDEQISKVFFKEAGFEGKPKRVKTQLKQEMKRELMAKESIDDVLDYLESRAAVGDVSYNANAIIRDVLEEAGYDGYTYAGKNHTGEDAYTGLVLTPNGAKKAGTKNQFKVPEPDFVAKTDYKLRMEKMLQDHGAMLEKMAKNVEATKKEPIIEENIDPIEKDPELQEAARNDAYEMYALSPAVKDAVDTVRADLEAKKASGKTLSLAEESLYNKIEIMTSNKDLREVAESMVKPIETFMNCLKGNL